MTNGILWNSLFQGDEDNLRHVTYGSWLWRDWNGAATSLTGLQMFEEDGNLISTLFDPVTDENPYGGWSDPGLLDEHGMKFAQKLETKPTKVMQSRWAARFDYTGQSEELSGVLMESNPVRDALFDNQLLSGLQSVGTIGYNTAPSTELDIKFRQCICIGIDGRSGFNYYIIRIYPKVLVVDFGDSEWNVEETDALPIHAMAIPDPWTTPPDGVNVGSPRWILRDGPAWRAQGGPTLWPDPQTAPVASAESGGGFQLVFQQPDTPNMPFTYAVTATTSDTPTVINSDDVTASTNSSGQVTLVGAAATLTDTDAYTFTVAATGANGTVSVASSTSNSITAS